MRTWADGSTSCDPSMSVWISEASPRQYSFDELVRKTLGCRRCVPSRSKSPPLWPVTGSIWGTSVNGGVSLTRGRSVLDGCPKRWLKSAPRPPPAILDQVAVEHWSLALVLVQAEIEEL